MFKTGLQGVFVAGFFAISATSAAAQAKLWQDWSLDDADKILECAAILDLLEVPADSLEAWPDGMVIDFPTASRVMQDRVRLHHGADFTTRRYAHHSDYWSTATPQDPKVADLEAFLETCRHYGTTHNLPM